MWITSQRPIIALAPMADMTDGPFCRVCRETSGKNFIIFREMVSAEAIVRGNEKTLKMCAFEEIERPIVLQIFGGQPERMAQAAQIIVEKFHPDGIDINMGCPVPKIAGKSRAGATLMKDHVRATAIVRAVKAENLGVPVSVKTRLGWSRPEEILAFAPKLEAAGADLLTIHGRTKAQGYGGKANWEMIGKAKKLLSIPVLANGDINSAADVKRCLEITGADGVMIGRGALGRPWVFRNFQFFPQRAGSRCGGTIFNQFPISNDQFPMSDLVNIVLRHAELHIQYYGPNSMATFRKHLAWYFKGMPNIKNLRQRLVKVDSREELKELLRKI